MQDSLTETKLWSALSDSRLSWKAVGILSYLVATKGQAATMPEMIRAASDGRHSLLTGIEELQDAGYPVERPSNDPRDIDTGTVLSLLREAAVCAECGEVGGAEIDHIVPVSEGGTSHPDNLRVICGDCNQARRGD